MNPDDQHCEFCGEPVDPSVEGDALAEVGNTRTGERKLVHSEPLLQRHPESRLRLGVGMTTTRGAGNMKDLIKQLDARIRELRAELTKLERARVLLADAESEISDNGSQTRTLRRGIIQEITPLVEEAMKTFIRPVKVVEVLEAIPELENNDANAQAVRKVLKSHKQAFRSGQDRPARYGWKPITIIPGEGERK